jgi:hypothetical protein
MATGLSSFTRQVRTSDLKAGKIYRVVLPGGREQMRKYLGKRLFSTPKFEILTSGSAPTIIEESFKNNPNVFFAEEFINPAEYSQQIFATDLSPGEIYKVRLRSGEEELRKFISAPFSLAYLLFETITSSGAKELRTEGRDSQQYFRKPESSLANFGSWPLEKQVERIIKSGTADSIRGFFSTTPSAKAVLKIEPMQSNFIKNLVQRGVVEKGILLDLYTDVNPVSAEFAYDEEPRIMFSQKGASCGSDALFTVLFECKDFSPVLHYDWTKFSGINTTGDTCIVLPKSRVLETLKSNDKYKRYYGNAYVGSSKEQYALALSAAKIRHNRMPIISKSMLDSYRGEMRRRASVSNNVWRNMRSPINTSCVPASGRGLLTMDMAIFLDKLLSENIFKIEKLPKFEVQFFDAPPLQEVRLDSICAILLTTYTKDSDCGYGHAIGFYKNDGDWFFVDNTIGYIHKILDTEWVNKEFLPRLINSVSDKADTTYENIGKKLLFIHDPSMNKFMINYQILAPGAKSYPNIKPSLYALQPQNIATPTGMIIITKRSAGAGVVAGAAAAGAASGAAAGAVTRGGRRLTRRRGRKTYRKRRS